MPGEQRTPVGPRRQRRPRRRLARRGARRASPRSFTSRKPYKQVSREWREENTLVTIAPGVVVRRQRRCRSSPVPAPSSPRSRSSRRRSAVRAAGATALRGGAFKPRSSPYAFQGLGKQGLELLALARARNGPAHRHRGARRRGRAPRRRVRRLHSDRRAQHAELLPAPRRRTARQAGAAQARHGGDDHRPAHERGVHPRRGKRPGDSLRARHSQLRHDDAQSVRPHRDSARAEAVAPADDRATRATARGCATR